MIQRAFKQLLVLGLVSLAASFACAQDGQAEQRLRIATGHFPPWVGDSLPRGGFVPAVLEEALASQGYEVSFDYLPWKRAMRETRNGRYDATAFWAEGAGDPSEFLRSRPILREKTVFFTAEGDTCPSWDRLADLSGERISATLGYTYTEEFWRLVRDETLFVMTVRTDLQSLQMLQRGRSDLAIMGLRNGLYLIQQEALTGLEVCPQVIAEQDGHVLFPRHHDRSAEFRELLDRGLQHLEQNGRLQQLRKQFIEVPAPMLAPDGSGRSGGSGVVNLAVY